MNSRTTLSIVLPLFLSALPLRANTFLGGEIQFQQVGERELEASVVFYYDNPDSGPAGRDSVLLCWGDGNCETLGVSNGPDENGDGAPDGELIAAGLRKNVYAGVHEYGALGTYTLSVRVPNRPGGILNLNFPNSDQVWFYTESVAVLSAGNPADNHSPVLLEAPVGIAIEGQPFIQIPNAFDIDDDSLAYELVTPLLERGLPAPGYIPPQLFPSGPSSNALEIEEETGVLLWDSPQRPGFYVVAIKIKSYRDGELRDQVTRDILIVVEEGDNLGAGLSLSEEATGIIDVAVGDTVLVEAVAEDPETVQQIGLTASCGLLEPYYSSPASFSAMASGNEAFGSFRWVVREEHRRQQPYSLVFRAQDDFLLRGLSAMKLLRYRVASAVAADEAGKNAVKRLEVFPNPAAGTVRIKLPGMALPVFYQLYHANGQLAASGVFRQEREELGLSALPPGMYVLRVGNAQEQGAVKIFRR